MRTRTGDSGSCTGRWAGVTSASALLAAASVMWLTPDPAAATGPVVSYRLSAFVTGLGNNGAGYTMQQLNMLQDVQLAYETTPAAQPSGMNFLYSGSAQHPMLLSLRIGNDTYSYTDSQVTITVTPLNATFDRMRVSGFDQATGHSLTLTVRYGPSGAGVSPGELPLSLPGSSFNQDANFSSLQLVRSAPDFYTMLLLNLAPALNPFCPPDFNKNGSLSVQDIFDFLAAYFAGESLADFNGAGGISVQDIFDFLAAYFEGCA